MTSRHLCGVHLSSKAFSDQGLRWENPTWSRRLAVLIVLVMILLLGGQSPSLGGRVTPCTYDAERRRVTVDVSVSTYDNMIRRDGDAIVYEWDLVYPCGEATVYNTDRIVLRSDEVNGGTWIDWSFGRFEPGATNEADGSPEIEFFVSPQSEDLQWLYLRGGEQSDKVDCPYKNFDLTGDGDADFRSLDRVAYEFEMYTNAGDDSVDLRSCALRQIYIINVFTGTGDDRLSGGSTDDVLFGRAGDDRILGRGKDDYVSGGWGNDYVSGGAGDKDRCKGGPGDDMKVGCERRKNRP